MVVYADLLFVTNFICAYIMLCLLGKLILKTKIKLWRIIMASAAAAAMATVVFSLKMPPFPAFLVRLFSVIIPVFTAFYDRKRGITGQIMWLFIMSVIMIGTMIILPSFMGKSTDLTVKNGVVYINLPMKIFVPLFVLSYILLTVFIKFIERRRQKRLYNVDVTYEGKKVNLTALFDSGNQLKDGISGKCVSLMDWECVATLMGLSLGYDDIERRAADLKLRCVPFRGAEGQGGVIYAFNACIFITDCGIYHKDTLIGIYRGRLSNKNEYRVLLNSSLI